VVGTGGAAENYTIGDPMGNTEIYNDETDGVLTLKLEENAYEWRFVPMAGESFTDSGSAGCH
jgi:acid phosphatase type 7